jgi:hypothetical protein
MDMAQRHVASCAKDAWAVCWNRRRYVVAMNARRIRIGINFLLMGYRDLHGIVWRLASAEGFELRAYATFH